MQPVQKIEDIKNIRPRPHASKLVRADAFFGSLKKNLLLWNQSSVYKCNYSYENWTLTNTQLFKYAALRRGKVDFPDHWCGRMKMGNYRKQDVTVSDLAPE